MKGGSVEQGRGEVRRSCPPPVLGGAEDVDGVAGRRWGRWTSTRLALGVIVWIAPIGLVLAGVAAEGLGITGNDSRRRLARFGVKAGGKAVGSIFMLKLSVPW